MSGADVHDAVSWGCSRHLDAACLQSYFPHMMRRSVAARVLSPLIGLWFTLNSGLFLVQPPCPMHGAGAMHASMSMPSSAGHSLGAGHHHGSKSADAHGCDCAGRCGNPPHQFAILELPALTPAVLNRTSVQPSDRQLRAPGSVRHLPFATGPPARLFV
jgi:hypothetical protein